MPGRVDAGFISATGADNGCRPYKANFPLHTSYTGTQLAFATSFLNSHQNTKLVTIQLGANDLFILENRCAGSQTCIAAGLPTVLATISSNMDTIFKAIDAAHFHGRLIVVNYYSLDYSNVAGTAVTALLNQALTKYAEADGAIVADAFTAFKQAAAVAAGKTCEAGLLNTTPGDETTCDVHPSQSGAELLAQAVLAAYQGSGGS